MFLTEDLITFNLRNFLLFQLWEYHLSLFLLFPNVFASSLPFSFSPGAGGFCTTLPPSFLRVDDRATSSTTDSSRAPSSPRPPGSTSHCGISTGCTERCLCVLPLRTSQVPDVMAPQHDQELFLSPTWKFHDLAYSCLGKSFSIWEVRKECHLKNVLHLVGLDSL
uniref:Uncharacterized protein n=1 Tax=Pan troglodytes TaxID=9598 RepID=H2Q096_PANTR